MTILQERVDAGGAGLLARLTSSTVRRNLRMASGLILFTYIGAHLFNHALGLISLDAAEAGMEIAVEVWYSLPGTILLYGAARLHFLLALWAVYERRTFRLPPAELLRIALGFTMPIMLIGHAVATRLAYDTVRVVVGLHARGLQYLGVGFARLAAGPDGARMAAWLSRTAFRVQPPPLYRRLRFVLFAVALLLPVFSGAGLHRDGAADRGQSSGDRGGAEIS